MNDLVTWSSFASRGIVSLQGFLFFLLFENGCREASLPTDDHSCEVEKLEKIGRGSFPKISPDGKTIAYTMEINDSDYQIYSMNIDGTDIHCLTCEKEALSNTRWRGQPSWHPSGQYIAFTAESAMFPRQGNGTSARPGIGRNHNVWIMSADGENFWQITNYPENWGVIRPRFSPNGNTLFWNEEFMMEKYPHGKQQWFYNPTTNQNEFDDHPGCYWSWDNVVFRRGEELCAWRIKLADIQFIQGTPTISNERAITPADGYTLIEASGFTSDGDGFAYSYCNIEEQGGQCFWGNIYTSDLQGQSLKQLTFDYRRHNENPELSPDNEKIIWNRSLGDPGAGEEMYLMSASGEDQTRLTFFSDPSSAYFNSNSRQIPESSWDPKGQFIVFSEVQSEESSGGLGPHIPGDLYQLKFKGACGLH